MHNFTEIARTFLENGAAVQVRSGEELEPVLVDLLGDPVRRATLGAGARALVEGETGAPATRRLPRSRSCCRPTTRPMWFVLSAGFESDRPRCLARSMRRWRADAGSATPPGRISAAGSGGR